MFARTVVKFTQRAAQTRMFAEVAKTATKSAEKVEKVIAEKVEQNVAKEVPKAVKQTPKVAQEASSKIAASQTTHSIPKNEVQSNVTVEAPKSSTSGPNKSTPKPKVNPPKKSKAKSITIWTLIGATGGLWCYSSHLRNDEYAQIKLEISHPSILNLLKKCYIVPSYSSFDIADYNYVTYITRLSKYLYEDNYNTKAPKPFATVGELKAFLKNYTILPNDVFEDETPMSSSVLYDYLSAIATTTPENYIYIIGERLYNMSPMTDFSLQQTIDYFNNNYVLMNDKPYITKTALLSLLTDMETLSKSSISVNPFVKNTCNSIFHSVTPSDEGKLTEHIEKHENNLICASQFINYMAIACRQIRAQDVLLNAFDYQVSDDASKHVHETVPEETKPAEVTPIEETKPAEVTSVEETKPVEVAAVIVEEETKPVEVTPIEVTPVIAVEETKPVEEIPVVVEEETKPAESLYWTFKAPKPVEGWKL